MRPIIAFFLFIAYTSTAQDDIFFEAIPDNASVRDNYIALVKTGYEQDANSAPAPYKSELKEFFKQRYEKLNSLAKDGILLADEKLESYLQSIAKEIVKANPELQSIPIHVHLTRQWWANAACYGDGTILINIGLLSRLQNEAQLAFVIAHEIAHQYKNHVNEDVISYITLINSKEFKRELSFIVRMEYGRNTALKELAKDISFDSKIHSRKHDLRLTNWR